MLNRKDEILEWIDDLALGDYSIDNHTKEFLRKSNEFIDAKNVGNGEERIDGYLNYLTEYAQKHFEAQEEMMKRINYPSIDDHISEHRMFVRSVAKLLKKRLLLRRESVPSDEYDERGIDGVINDTADLIRDWYHSHLLGTDKRLYGYYNYEYNEDDKKS